MMTPGTMADKTDKTDKTVQTNNTILCLRSMQQKLESSSLPYDISYLKNARNSRNISISLLKLTASSTSPASADSFLTFHHQLFSRSMDEIHYSEFENPNFDAKVSWQTARIVLFFLG